MLKILISWLIAASLFASAGHRVLPKPFVDELAAQIDVKPMFQGIDGALKDAGLMASLAWIEGGNVPDAVGDCPGMGPGDPKCTAKTGAQSWCAFQIHLPQGQKTNEGWTGPELAADAKKCITVARRLVESSIKSKENKEGKCPLCVYARGRWTPEGQKLSDFRMGFAKKLLKEVHVEEDDGECPY
jgi:hypothetical protein